MALFYFLTILAFSVVVGIIFYFGGRKTVRKRRRDYATATLLSIQVPRVNGSLGARDHFKEDAKKFEAFLKRIASFRRECSLELSVEHIGDDIHFRVSVPLVFVSSVQEEVYLLWPGARVNIIHSGTGIFGIRGVSIGGYIIQKKDHLFSVKTHRVLETDPLALLLEGFSKANKIGEGASMQIVLCPVSHRHKKSIARSLSSIMRGELGEIVARSKLISANGISIPSVGDEIEERKKREKIKKDMFNFAWNKLSQPIFEANVRVCVSAGTKFRAQEIVDEITASFSRFDDPHHNEFKFVKPRNMEKFIEHFVARRFSASETVVLSSEEISSFYRFPTISEKKVIGIRQHRSKHIPVPSGLSPNGICIGENEFHGESRPVFLGDDNRGRHIYIVGEGKTGKSTLVGNMLVQEIKRGQGVALIDPRGRLAQTLLGQIPAGRAKDVIYLDMGDTAKTPGIDVLRLGPLRRSSSESSRCTAEEKRRMARELCGILNKFFELETRGIMFDEYMENAILLLLESAPKNANIFDVPRVFVDRKYRANLLSKSKNNKLTHFWEHEARSSSGEAAIEDIAPFIFSGFKKFASSDMLQSIFQDPASAVDIEYAVDKGKVILINLNEDKLGKTNSNFIGMLIANKILAAAHVDALEVNQKKNKQFSIYFDDCGGYAPDSVAKIVSGRRKHHMNLALVTRSVADLSMKTKEAIFKNTTSKVVFRVNSGDAEILASEFGPLCTKHDFISADDFDAYARINIRGKLSAPFSIKVENDSWSIGNAKITDKIKEHSRVSYYRDIRELEKEVRRKAIA